MKTRIIAYITILAVITFSCSEKELKTPVDNSPTVSVKVNTVNAENSKQVITASGKIAAAKSANLSTRMMGFVNKINVKVGDKVSKGQLLLSINSADLLAKRAQVNASITQATAGFENAEKDYNRFKALFAQQSATQKEMDDMTTHYQMAKAGLEAVKQMKNEIDAQFTYTNIRAPFAGVITNKFIEVGDMANPGMPLIAVESPSSFEVTAMVPESEISKIKSGAKVAVLIKSINVTVQGEVSEVSSSAKNTGGQYLVKIVLDKTEASILSGMFATVQFSIESKESNSTKVLLPLSAIITNGGLKGVYTVSEQNTALLRWLKLGKVYGDKIEVLSGLKSGEQYILSAKGKLYNRAKLAID